MKHAKLKISMVLFMLVALFLRFLATKQADLTEQIYSKGFYRVISLIGSKAFGIFPFSVFEFLVILGVITLIVLIVIFFVKLIKKKHHKGLFVLNSLSFLIAVVAFVYGTFILFWGINYYRNTAYDVFELEKTEATLEVLDAMVYDLSLQAQKYRKDLFEDDNGVMLPNNDIKSSLKRAKSGYDKVGMIYTELSGNYSNPKPITFSKLYSYTKIYGVFSPFTFEANVNTNVPTPLLLATTCHEMAHQRGFAREDEANFIAFLVCVNHEDLDFKYSGTLLALRYSLNTLYRFNKDLYYGAIDRLDEGIVRDLEEISAWSKRYDSFLDDISDRLNDIFLKSNGQSDGKKSYGRMVDLLLANYLKK